MVKHDWQEERLQRMRRGHLYQCWAALCPDTSAQSQPDRNGIATCHYCCGIIFVKDRLVAHYYSCTANAPLLRESALPVERLLLMISGIGENNILERVDGRLEIVTIRGQDYRPWILRHRSGIAFAVEAQGLD